MRVKQAVLMLAAGVMTVGLAGCGQKTKDYDVYFFNSKSEIAESLNELAMECEAETGERVETFIVGATESAETMCSELKSRDYPTVFTSSAVAFEEWKSAGFTVGVDGIMNPKLEALYEELSDTIKLQFDGEGNYGILCNAEGYSLIANKRMIMDILGLDNIRTFQEDYAEAGYEEFQNMIVAMDAFIKGKPGQAFTLNGKPYAAAGGENGITKNLNSVFPIAGAEKRAYGNHFGNRSISAIYRDTYDVRGTDVSKADQMLELLVKSLQESDLLTRYATGADGPVERGPRFINSAVAGYDQAVQTFAEGKTVFIKNGNWICSNVAKISEDVAEDLMVLPMKLNFDDSDITVEGLGIKQMNRSIPESVSRYYVINAKAAEQERKDAEDFVLWLNTSETETDLITNRFAFVPLNADEHAKLDNPLLNELINYKLKGDLLTNPFDAVPTAWGAEMYGKYLTEQLFINPEDWSEETLRDIARECIDYWKSGTDEW